MFDTHVHTIFSTDCKMKIEEAIKKGKEDNIGLIITEHLDLNFMKPGEFIFDISEYFNKYLKYRNENLLLGVELGMRTDCIDENKLISKDNPFDYIIGSTHVVKDMDLYYEDFYKGKSKREAYIEYLKCMFDCIKEYDFIDSLGHIDYICRYSIFKDKELYYKEFSDYIDGILKILVTNEKAIEINTRRLGEKESINNLIHIYKRFYELGGKFVTIGSDAHTIKTIGNNYNIAKEIADLCNLKVVYFKNRKMEYEN